MGPQMNYEELDSGIRDIVRKLREAGFETTDSGDGSKYDTMGGALAYPHVFIEVPDAGSIIDEAHRAATLLGDDWEVEASYSTRNKIGMLAATLTSALLEWERKMLTEISKDIEE